MNTFFRHITVIFLVLAATSFARVSGQNLDSAAVTADTVSPWLTFAPQLPPLPDVELREAVFDRYDIVDTLTATTPAPSARLFKSPAFDWLDRAWLQNRLVRQARQRYMIENPSSVRYNEALLPEPPRKFHAEVDPATARITLVDGDGVVLKPDIQPDLKGEAFKKRHWIKSFDARLQFAQAYVSPNWYQGGSNNLTMLLGASYSVKLNEKFHPNLLCEASVSYKLNVHGTPEDSLRNYNISEDLLQFNGKVGIRAAKRWFYSLSAMFKTQFFHSYEVNKPQLKAGFMSPGELNLGAGMTYNYNNEKKSFVLGLQISPISWNMKTCIERDMNVEDFGIRAGHKVVHEFGSNAEMKLEWHIAYNIRYQSRMFIFTDYDYLQGDWENTFSFDINRFLSTQLQVRLRYDSSTPREEDSRWHLWQLNEVLSFGFSYKFATI